MTFSHKTVMVVHFKDRFHLCHGVEIDADKNEQGSAAQQIRHLTRKIKEPLNQGRNERDKGEIQRSRQYDAVEDLCEVLFHFIAPDARNRTAIFTDILGNFLRVQGYLCVEIRKEDDEHHVEEIVPESVRSEPIGKISQPLRLNAETLRYL